MILSAAQIHPVQGNITKNITEHCKKIGIAAENGAELIVFPEMSLSGYDRENAHLLAFTKDDSRLDKLKILATDKNIIVIAGAAIRINSTMYIGSFIIYPSNSISIYTKQFPHSGEENYFSFSSELNPTIKLNSEQFSLAICADINNPIHPQNAFKTQSSFYLASIFFTLGGISDGHTILSSYAKQYSMNVLMSNFCGKSWGLEAGGKSAFWDNTGKLIGEITSNDSGLLVVEKNASSWVGQTIIDK